MFILKLSRVVLAIVAFGLMVQADRIQAVETAKVSTNAVAPQPAPLLTELKLPGVFSYNMVLQRDIPVPVWGWAAPGDEIVVKIAGQEVKGQADEKGQWKLKLAAMKAGGPYEMTVSGKSTITFKNVMVGEVWIASGQSNMQFELQRAANANEALADAKRPELRLLNGPAVSWVVSDPTNAGSFSAVAYFFGRELQEKLKVPVGMIASALGATHAIPWIPAVGYEGVTGIGKAVDGPLYKEKIQPFVPYAIRGAIWYQGEHMMTFTGSKKPYTQQMQALVGGWRKVWGQPPPLFPGAPGGDFPFYFVQIPPFIGYSRGEGDKGQLPWLWEAQAKALAITNTGMAVITDVKDVAMSLHPPRKEEVGHRLVLLALARTYGQTDLVYSGPVYKAMAVEDGKIRLKFESIGGGLASRDGKPLDFFLIAGEDKKFVPAKAEIDGESVVVSADGVVKPAAVRFAWNDVATPNLMNKEELPASSFRTDHW